MSKAQGDGAEGGEDPFSTAGEQPERLDKAEKGDGSGSADAGGGGDLTIYLFGRTGREKEEWFRRLLHASRVKLEGRGGGLPAVCKSGQLSQCVYVHVDARLSFSRARFHLHVALPAVSSLHQPTCIPLQSRGRKAEQHQRPSLLAPSGVSLLRVLCPAVSMFGAGYVSELVSDSLSRYQRFNRGRTVGGCGGVGSSGTSGTDQQQDTAAATILLLLEPWGRTGLYTWDCRVIRSVPSEWVSRITGTRGGGLLEGPVQ